MSAGLIIAWIIAVAVITIFNYGAHRNDEPPREPDETSHRGRYRYTHPELYGPDDEVIF